VNVKWLTRLPQVLLARLSFLPNASLTQGRGGHFRPEDKNDVREAILFVAKDLASAQERAQLLHALLRKYTWSKTAEQFGNALGLQPYLKKLIDIDLSTKVDGDFNSISAARTFASPVYETAEAASLLLSKARFAYALLFTNATDSHDNLA
jgi:hypothetical protein